MTARLAHTTRELEGRSNYGIDVRPLPFADAAWREIATAVSPAGSGSFGPPARTA